MGMKYWHTEGVLNCLSFCFLILANFQVKDNAKTLSYVFQ